MNLHEQPPTQKQKGALRRYILIDPYSCFSQEERQETARFVESPTITRNQANRAIARALERIQERRTR